MTIADCNICAFLPTKDPVLVTNYWSVSLSPDQGYLGRCYVTLNTHRGALADLSNDAWLDYADIVKQLEAVVKQVFGAKLFNWTCLMNNAFQEEQPSPHVHWHFRPRYSQPIDFAGENFTDPQFGHHYDREQRQKVSEEVLKEIRDKIKSALKPID